MPITQEQMILQMKESRAGLSEMRALRDLILGYCQKANETYAGNAELVRTMTALSTVVLMRPIPDDRETYLNEKYYQRFAKRNAKAKERQTLIRNGIIEARGRKYRKRKSKEQYGQRGEALIFPREDPDDKELEFDTQEDLAPFANLPTPKDAKDLQSGLDFQPNAGDNDEPSNLEEDQ